MWQGEGLDGERRPSIVDVSDEQPEGGAGGARRLRGCGWRGNNGSDGGGGGRRPRPSWRQIVPFVLQCLTMVDWRLISSAAWWDPRRA